MASDEAAIFDLAKDDFSERVRLPSYVNVSDKFIIKIDQYVRMINSKYKLEKEGLSTVQINDGELEIQDSEVEESDAGSDISDADLEESDDMYDPEKKRLKQRDAYMLRQYAGESQAVNLSKEDLERIKKEQKGSSLKKNK